MAVAVGKTVKELQKMCEDMGIKVIYPANGRIKKESLIQPIREHNLVKRYGSLSTIPKHLKLVLGLKSPMLAGRIDKFKDEQQEEVWNDENWDMEQKLNGVRTFLVNDGSGLHMYSRHNSDLDLLPIEFTGNILLPNKFDIDKLNKEFIIDCEMTSDRSDISTILSGNYGVETESQLQAVTAILGSLPDRAIEIQKQNDLYFTFNSFDCIYYDKKWIMNEPLSERRKYAEDIISTLEKAGFNIRRVPHTNVNKKKFFKYLIDNGCEGTVAKRLDGKYVADTTRNFKGWIKCKRSLSSSLLTFNMDEELTGMGLGDTIDAFITGYERGKKDGAFRDLVGSVCVSVYVRKKNGELEQREIAKFSGFPLDLRKQMTETIDGEPTLKAEYYGKVVEIDGQNMTKNGRFQHCIFCGFRYDKLKDSCVMDEEFLESQVF